MGVKELQKGTVYLQSSLKAFELDSRIMEEKYGLKVRQIDYDNDADLEIWMSIIHTSYDDCHFTVNKAREFLVNHLFMDNTKTFLFQEVMGGVEVATVSIGLYKANHKIGGDFRIGVTQSAQGKGYGRLCILFAYSQLAAMGVKYGESAITIKRKKSLQLHYALGFKPQTDLHYVVNENSIKTIKDYSFVKKALHLRFVLKSQLWAYLLQIKLKQSYRDYLNKERNQFVI